MSESPQQQSTFEDLSVKVETPLHYYLGRFSGDPDAGVVVREAALIRHLILRGDPGNELFASGVEEVLSLSLPAEPGTWTTNADASLYWLGPNEWLIIVPRASELNVETRLRQMLHGHFSVVDISGAQTLVNLSGKDIDLVLKKASGYDFHPSNFEAGRCVQTTFAKASALVCKRADGSFDLVIRRSFADYVAKWLLDAGREFGCRIDRAPGGSA